MWCIPFEKGKNHYIYITFDEETVISGLKIWNYNSIEDGIDKGVKLISIIADQTYLTPKSGSFYDNQRNSNKKIFKLRLFGF